MKSRMLRKVLGYFLFVLLLFALVVGLIFFRLGQRSITAATLTMAEHRAESIAASLTAVLYHDAFTDFVPAVKTEPERRGQEPDPDHGHGTSGGPTGQSGRGYQNQKAAGQGHRIILWMNELLSTDINLVVGSDGAVLPLHVETIALDSLTTAERDIADRALQGETASLAAEKRGSRDLYILTATPLYDAEERIVAALLLREDAGISYALVAEAQRLLAIAIGIAAVLVTILALFMTQRLLRPLRRIQKVTRELSDGRYEVRTEITQSDELGALAEDVDALALRLAEARRESLYLNELREDFISSMSHELKTPVTVMKSSLEALQQGLVAEAGRQGYYDVLYQEINLLERLIQDLTDLNVLRNEKYPLQQEELNVMDVLRDAIRSQRLIARDRSVVLEDRSAGEALYIQGDYARIRQMFVIVLNNAIKYSATGGRVTIEHDQAAGTLTITNEGKEIAADSLPRIFEPFYRDKNSREKGVGLGLSIARTIADRHGIDIQVNSGGGLTSFAFRFQTQ